MQNVLNDLRYALRQLRRSPVFTLTAVLTLALGVWSEYRDLFLLDQALLRALPVRDPQRLVYPAGDRKCMAGAYQQSLRWGAESYFVSDGSRPARERCRILKRW